MLRAGKASVMLSSTLDALPSSAGFDVESAPQGLPTHIRQQSVSSAYAPAPGVYQQGAAISAAVGFVLYWILPEGYRYAAVVLSLCAIGLCFSKYLSVWLLSKDDGTPEMRQVSEPIREGSEAFLKTQYTAIAKMAVVVCAFIFVSYQLRPADLSGGVNSISPLTLGFVCMISFVMGAACSAFAGYVSMVIASRTNIRVTSAASRGYVEALAVCFRGGAFSAVVVLALCVMGVTILHSVLYTIFADDFEVGSHSGVTPADIPLLCVGYGFGASFVALFMQLGGGIYTKVR
jgi:Na+/H+-translocating membrane pyrophosphatase